MLYCYRRNARKTWNLCISYKRHNATNCGLYSITFEIIKLFSLILNGSQRCTLNICWYDMNDMTWMIWHEWYDKNDMTQMIWKKILFNYFQENRERCSVCRCRKLGHSLARVYFSTDPRDATDNIWQKFELTDVQFCAVLISKQRHTYRKI